MTIQNELDTNDAYSMVLTIGNTETYFLVIDNGSSPYNLAGATVLHLSVKEETEADDGSPEEIFDKDLLSDPNHDLPNGKIAITIASTDIVESAITDIDGMYKWDIRIVHPTLGTFNAPQPVGNCVILPRSRRTD